MTVFRLGRRSPSVTGRGRAAVHRPDARDRALRARAELGGRTVSVPLHAPARTLSYGSSGPDVLALRSRLAELHVHVPGPSTTFGSELYDSVIAFQKARGLSRTGTVDDATWRALSQDVVPAPRYKGAARTSRSRRAARS